MINNFTPKKSGTAARPQLSPEEYAAKKKAEKDAVYQMIDDTAAAKAAGNPAQGFP